MVTKEKRQELYKLQCEAMKPEHSGDSAFCRSDFRCWHCNADLLSDPRELERAEKGILLSGCTFCHKSFVS